MKDKQCEIEVLENMIRILNECFVLFMKEMHYKSAKNTLSDIQKCKKELKRLKETESARDAEMDAAIQ